MGQFRLLPDYFIKQATRLCDELMFGLEPVVNLSNIKDELTNSQKGFSFVTNPQNNLDEAYLELFKQACATPQKENLSRRGQWNWQAVFKYIKKEEAFRGFLGLAIHIAGGQTPRWSELLSLWCENAEFGERGIYVYGGYMIYLMRHHKAKRSTNREFIVVRFLPAEVAHLLYKYLVYIRRFVDMLERERGGQSTAENSPLLFRSENAPTSKPWPTGRFNAILKDATNKVWGHAVNSRLLRQLCIGITEKHVREIHKPFNRFDDTSQTAHRNVVFAWQSGHRPLQRAVTYGLDGAFPTTLQPQLLELYEWASTRWHEFLHLPSKITGTITRSLDKALPFPSDSTKISKPNQSSNDQSIPVDRDEASDSHSVSSWTPSPPPKRRRINQRAPSPQPQLPVISLPSHPGSILRDNQKNSSPSRELDKPLFIKERRAVIELLDNYKAGKQHTLAIEFRLKNILETIEWWRTSGCQLCYAITGKLEPDHDMNSCVREADCKRAKSILRWLESLDIPRSSSRGRGEVIIGDHAQMARSPGARDYWIKHFDSKEGPDGHCENKPIIRQVIAVLCTYDDQFLGKLEAREFWFSNLFLVFETLVLMFYVRQNRKRQAPELCGFPRQPAGLAPWPMKPECDSMGTPRWDNAEEVSHWEASIKWWVGKCSFCAGRGLRGASIQHKLRQCKRGGKATLSSQLSEAMYEEGFLPSNGCNTCRLPHDLCSAWMRNDEGEWALADTAHKSCQYDRYLLADTIIGLYYCGKSEFQQQILDQVEEYCERNDLEPTFDGETVACCLLQEVTVVGVNGSEMIRMLAILTQMVWDAIGEQ
ncbi:hypothetical protein V8C42DRAFT_361765 [Trichoderma barbatum]